MGESSERQPTLPDMLEHSVGNGKRMKLWDKNGNAHSRSTLLDSMRRLASEVRGFGMRMRQREIARTLGFAMNVKPLYTRNRGGSLYDRGWYDIGGWRVSGKHIITETFTLDTMPRVLKALEALGQARVCAGRRAGAPLCTEALQHGDGDERLHHSGRTA